jgi:hypothetical protein
MQYGQGFGTSKKQAKSEAAKSTLEILIPEMRDKIQQDNNKGKSGNKEPDLCVSLFLPFLCKVSKFMLFHLFFSPKRESKLMMIYYNKTLLYGVVFLVLVS